MRRHFFETAILLLVLLCSGCFDQPRIAPTQALPLPTKDEVVLVDGRRLTLNGYLAIRSELGPDLPTETALWIAVGALVLQNETRASGNEISASSALLLSRYAAGQLPPGLVDKALDEYGGAIGRRLSVAEVKGTIETLMKRSVIRRNMQALAEIDRTVTKH